jgi:hypothetical protein
MEKLRSVYSASGTRPSFAFGTPAWEFLLKPYLNYFYGPDDVAVSGVPLKDITELQRVKFVMKSGSVFKNDFR